MRRSSCAGSQLGNGAFLRGLRIYSNFFTGRRFLLILIAVFLSTHREAANVQIAYLLLLQSWAFVWRTDLIFERDAAMHVGHR